MTISQRAFRLALPLGVAVGWIIESLALAEPPPLFFSSGPLRANADGASTRGIPRVESVADTGDGSWLAVWSHTPEPDPRLEFSAGRIVARMVNPSLSGWEPIILADQRATNDQLVTVRGTGGAWVVWQSGFDVLARWVSASTGRAEGEPLVLSAAAPVGTLHAAGDGTTAWVAWAPGFNDGSLQGVTLGARSDSAQLTGRFSLPGLSRFNNGFAIAARGGTALVAEVALSEGSGVFATRTHRLGPTGSLVDGPHILEGPVPDAVDSLYGILSHGQGWMIVWSQRLTPALLGSIVYGRILRADGVAADQPVQALFVEPAGAALTRGLASVDGIGLIAMPRETEDFPFAQVAVVQEGSPLYVEILGQFQPFRSSGPEPRIALGFSGSRIALLTPRGERSEPPTAFVQEIILAELTGTLDRRTISSGPGVQEEPALAWLPGKSVVAWQQITVPQGAPEILVRQRGPDGNPTAPDIIIPRPFRGYYSSPSLAATGTRLLLVARHDTTQSVTLPAPDADDVVGVLLENDRTITEPFTIAGGPGSQRAARVAAWGDGFCVAWREELNQGTPDLLYRIRCTFLNRDGTFVTPAGLTLAAAMEELSAPTLATHGTSVAIGWRRRNGDRSHVDAVTLVGTAPDAGPTTTLFGDAFLARSPEVVWDGQSFTFAARLRSATADVDNLGLARLVAGGSQPLPLKSIDSDGREPALAELGPAGTAVLWFDHKNGVDASHLWMAVTSPDGTTSRPHIVYQGRFDRDTLIARGDTHGRVMVALHNNALGEEGIRTLILAPGVTQPPVLQNLQVLRDAEAGPWPGLSFHWHPNVLFPARLESVETSQSLDSWDRVPSGLGEVTEPPTGGPPVAHFRTVSRLPNPQPPTPFYRLRALQAQ